MPAEGLAASWPGLAAAFGWLPDLAGAGLIIGSTTAVGWKVAGAYARRPMELWALQSGLAVLRTEIEYGATPLPLALTSAAEAAGGSPGRLLARAADRLTSGGGITPGEALRGTVAELGGETALTRHDLEILLALAAVLGASDRADQVRHLTLARERLAAEEARAQADRSRYERVARYMGVLTGAALVFIFM